MRLICGVMSVLMLVFAVVQYNDPDALFWGITYGAAGVWAGLATLWPKIFFYGAVRILLGLSLGAAGYGLWYFFPTAENWWQIQVWWETETAREGMGFMFVLLALISTVSVAFGRHS